MDLDDLMGSSEINYSFIHIRIAYIFHKALVYSFCPFETLLYLFGDYFFFSTFQVRTIGKCFLY